MMRTGMNERCRVLITGADSYIGSAVETWLKCMPAHYAVTVLDMTTDAWRDFDFSAYDVVFHVAALVHRKIRLCTKKEYALYYKVNTELAVDVANKARESGVRQFIFMSTMSVYSGCKETCITEATLPKAKGPYGSSKWKAEEALKALETDIFKMVILRPPLVYGVGCKGNYVRLKQLAGFIPFFPRVDNKRSMLHIDNLCRFVKLMIDNNESGVFFPQDKEYINTSELVYQLAKESNHKIIMIPGLGRLIKMTYCFPGGLGSTMKKLFGDYIYEYSISEYKEEYRK